MKHYTLISPRHKQKLKLLSNERTLNRFQRRLIQFPTDFNKYKSTIERFMFGQFTVCKPLPDSIDIGSNRRASISYRASKEVNIRIIPKFSRWLASIRYRKQPKAST